MGRKKQRKSKKEKKEKNEVNLKEKITEVLELPKEIVLNVPKLTIMGNSDIMIENYKGIVEYEQNRVRINTAIGVIKITGNMLTIREITSEDIMVIGDIISLEFLR